MGVNGHWYVELEKQGFWRGAVHTWVNRYVMSGAQPSASDAQTVITALKGIEDHVYPALGGGTGSGFVQGRAYPSGTGTYFASIDYNISLVASTSTGFTGPTTVYETISPGSQLEACLVVETKLTGLSTTGKPIYLRKYLRGFAARYSEDSSPNPINAGDLATIAAAVAPWRTGVGASNWVVIGNSGAQAAAAPAALPYVGNRQVPKGRKKKVTSADVLTRLVHIVQENPELALLGDL